MNKVLQINPFKEIWNMYIQINLWNSLKRLLTADLTISFGIRISSNVLYHHSKEANTQTKLLNYMN